MSAEIITMIAIGIVMISIQMTTFIYLLNRMDKISERMDAMQKDIGAVSERVARLEGILIGRLEVGNGAMTQTGNAKPPQSEEI